MSTSWGRNSDGATIDFAALPSGAKDKLREWLTQAWEYLDRDAVQSQNVAAMAAVRTALRESRELTNDANSGEVLGRLNEYQRYYEYALAHPTDTGRIHAAPPLSAAVPFVVVSGQNLGSEGATVEQWNALVDNARRFYPAGDNLLAAVIQWQTEAGEAPTIVERAAGVLGADVLRARPIRLGRLYREALRRYTSDARRTEQVNPPPATHTGDVTQPTVTGEANPAALLVLAIGAYLLLKGRGR